MSEKEFKSPITVKEEEIDLGGIFKMIGNTINKLFNSFLSLLKFLYHYLILILLFFKTHLKLLLSAIIIGAILGYLIDFISPTKYTYDMIIQPNYKSIDQIYENVEYYNVLIASKDSVNLSKEFDIDYKTANSIVEFSLIPYETEKDKILAYDSFIRNTDTLTHKHFSYDDFKGKGTSKFDSKYYVFRIVSYKPKLKSFENKIISDIEKNPLLTKKRKIKRNIIKLDSIATQKAIKDANELRSLYKETQLKALENQNKLGTSTTYIDFSKENNLNNDIELFTIVKNLNQNLINLEASKEESEEIVNVLTSFNPSGKKLTTLYETLMFKISMFLVIVILSVILLGKLNKYLNSYSQNNNL